MVTKIKISTHRGIEVGQITKKNLPTEYLTKKNTCNSFKPKNYTMLTPPEGK